MEEPVVYRGDLADEEVDYLQSQRARIERVFGDRLGLALEVRAEGWVAVDETGDLSDLRWPDYGAAETTALRLCDELRRRRNRAAPDVWPEEELVGFVRDLAAEYAGSWKKGAEEDAGSRRLAAEAVEILVAARLGVREQGGGLRAEPGAARYALASAPPPAPVLRGPADDGPSVGEP